MKIAIFEINAGLHFHVHPLCDAFTECCDEVTLISTCNAESVTAVSDRVKKEYILDNYHKLGARHSLKWVMNRCRVSIFNLVKRNILARKQNYDVVNIQYTVPVFDQFFIRSLHRHTKIVLTVHDVIPPFKSPYWSMKALKRIYSISDGLIVHSESNKQQLLDLFNVSPQKITVIPCWGDMSTVAISKEDARKQLSLDPAKKYVLFFGGIREQKGLDVLLNAMDTVNAVTIIAGALPFGYSFKQYQRIIDQKKLDVISMTRFITDGEMDLLFKASDVLAIPYKYFYSQSGVFLQGYKYGLPVVATAVGGFREYVEKYGIGSICEPDNPASLQQAIIEELHKPAYSEEVYERARNENCLTVCSEQYVKLLKKMCKEPMPYDHHTNAF